MPGTLDQLMQIEGALKSVAKTATETADHVERESERANRAVKTMTEEGGSKLDDFRFTLENIANAGNQNAQFLVGIINDVLAGLTRAEDAVHAAGDGFVLFEGQMRRAQDVLAQILPSTGEVQRRIKEAIAEVGTFEQVIARLNEQTNAVARDFARMVDAFRRGNLSLEELMRTAAEVKRNLPGSETAGLAEIVEQLARQGGGG